jgi:GNAT superfamily N-acetyltransferase
VAVALRQLSDAEVATFAPASLDANRHERVRSGEAAEVVAADSDGLLDTMFPDGRPRPGHLLWRIEDDAQPVGTLWIGPASPDDPRAYWVWDIVIDEPHRGRGLGRQAMRLAEDQARGQGATTLGLTVFAHNPVAWHLYEGLGYAPVSARMTKTL